MKAGRWCQNDLPPRLVKTVTEKIGTVRSEKRLADTLGTLEEMKRLEVNFGRGKSTKEAITNVMDKFLDNL